MLVTVVSSAGKVGSVDLADCTFAADYNEALVHQVVIAYMAGSRHGTKAHKSRAEVSGGGAKPWRQKGLGRARAGSIRSPLWRGGGVTFAAGPRSFRQKVNRKMYRGAMRAIFSELIRRERLLVVEDFAVEKPKTKDMTVLLDALGLADVLVLTAEKDDKLALASRNIPRVAVQHCGTVNPVSLLTFETVVVTLAAARRIEERFA